MNKKEKKDPYDGFIPPTMPCKNCGREMEINDLSRMFLKERGPYKTTYMYRCDCCAWETQMLPLSEYPEIGKPLKGVKR